MLYFVLSYPRASLLSSLWFFFLCNRSVDVDFFLTTMYFFPPPDLQNHVDHRMRVYQLLYKELIAELLQQVEIFKKRDPE